ncbi:MAG: AAA family ATPase, partial [Phaeodactylibacter sp.]|nr:AAA family ATPase [Phaeodactylibacter sp.]
MPIDEINENEGIGPETEREAAQNADSPSDGQKVDPEQETEAWRLNHSGLNKVRVAANRIKEELGKVIIGQEELMELLLAGMLSGGHVLLEGVPGIAKTLTAKLMARTLDVAFSRIQFTPDLMPSDVLGTTVFNMKTSEFTFNAGPIFSNIILIDEINRAPAKTQAAL